MESVEKLVFLCIRYEERKILNSLHPLPHPSPLPTFVLSSFEDRKFFLLADAEKQAFNSIKNNTPVNSCATVSYKEVDSMITTEICKDLMCITVKQAVEKIDSMRDSAGSAFYRLLYATNPSLPNIPHRYTIIDIEAIFI